MRWDEQRVENDLRLPGVGDGTVTRTFDAPEAMGINFHEVRARSALNHVAGGRYGFDWTINPFPGMLACLRLLPGGRYADPHGRWLDPTAGGRSAWVTRSTGRCVEATIVATRSRQVQAHWETRKDAYRVTLEDGTELIASGDHRFLTERGWKYVIGAEQGPLQRPYLTLE